MTENPRSRNTRSKDFRYVYSNGLAAQFGGNEVTLVFGIKEDPSTKDEKMLEEVAVIMTPLTVKSLAISLTKMIEHFEKTTGNVLPVQQDRLDQIDKILDDATAAVQSAKTSPTA